MNDSGAHHRRMSEILSPVVVVVVYENVRPGAVVDASVRSRPVVDGIRDTLPGGSAGEPSVVDRGSHDASVAHGADRIRVVVQALVDDPAADHSLPTMAARAGVSPR